MKKTSGIVICLIMAPYLYGATLNVEGTYTTQYKSTSALTFKGALESKEKGIYEGDIIAPWNGRDETYHGTITLNNSKILGDFILKNSKRRFIFEGDMSGGYYRGDVKENGGRAGVLDMKISGGSTGPGGFDYAELVSEAVSQNTGIEKDKVAELFQAKDANKDYIISVCAVVEVTKGDMTDLYKKRKKVNTNFEFLRDLKLDKDVKAKVDDLIKKIKNAVEDGKTKKK